MAEHQLQFFGLTTCIHCKHTREFLEKNNLQFDITYMDKLEGEERTAALKTVREYNPQLSFPTLIIDGGETVIVGFKPEAISKALEL